MKERKGGNEISLWNNFLRGDDEAYALIFERYVRVLFIYGSRFSEDRELVKDCIQDVFVNIYYKRERLSSTENVKYYLFGALRNSILNAFKKNGTRNSLYGLLLEAETRLRDQRDRLEVDEDEKAMQQKISDLMEMLTPRQKQVIHYRYIDNLSITEISDALSMSYQAVLNTIQRAIKRIRTNYPN